MLPGAAEAAGTGGRGAVPFHHAEPPAPCPASHPGEGDGEPGITREVLCGNSAAQLSPCSWLTGSPQKLEEQELRARRAKDRLRDRQRSLQQRLELLLLPTDGERARADSLDSSQLSEPSEEGKKGERKNGSGQGVKADKGLTWPSPVPRGCRGRGGWCGVQRGPAAQLWHWEGPQLLQPPQPRILTVPAAFPALPACLLPAGNPASASLITAASVRGHTWGHESSFAPHSWVALTVALGAWGWHCTVAPALEEELQEGSAATEDTLLPPPVHP